VPLVTALIEKGADVNAPRDVGFTPLHYAAQHDSADAAALLIAHGGRLDAREGSSGHTPLHWAAYCDAGRVAGLLIARGADVNARDDEGRTPLDLARERESKRALRILGATAEGNEKTRQGR